MTQAKNTPKRLMIMAAGTGGHIFPGLAIAATMRAKGWQVSWLGTSHGMEGKLVAQHGIAMDVLEFSGLRGKGWRHSAQGVVRLVTSFFRSVGFMKSRQPDVVLGMGGYVTVPGGMSARWRKTPLVVVNADAALLLSNKALLPAARKVLFGFPVDFDSDPRLASLKAKALVTGNPVRAEILALPQPAQRFAGRIGPLKVLVVGGSLGAQALNTAMPQALARIPLAQRPIVTHQSGAKHIESLRAAYAQAGVEATVVDFIDDMAVEYAQADVVLCRAGAITLSELTAAGVASVLVPFVASTTSHQVDNAEFIAAHKAGLHLPQKQMSADSLAQLFLQTTREQCLQWAQAAYSLGRRNANEEIAKVLQEVAG
ncbi:MAG: undecaprenyldiphospho-muramoylpentapeptide beta-N-acetylglucosaminyltransferase [Burkholderiales bacterium]|nr:undecaprenyldiphospho-muramoylpentapeptide beta-N-acetylglucosaminyltransferase [Burkholderiales bacterium]